MTRIAFITLVAGWFFTIAHQVAFHCDNEMRGHSDGGGAKSECVCICACHTALEPAFDQELSMPERTIFVPSEYVILPGTYVPNDIFRPPLATS